MSALNKALCRLKFKLEDHSATLEATENKAPWIWRGNDVEFQLAAYLKDVPVDISAVTRLTLEIKPLPGITGAALFTGRQTSGFGTTMTDAQWVAGTAQHFTIPMAAADNDIALSGISLACHLYARAECYANGVTTAWTLGKAVLTIEEDGSTTVA